MDEKKNRFESTIKPILLWMGTIVAAVMAVAYIIVAFVLIEGFKAETILNTTIFSIITAVIGFCIMQMLKIQGQSFAANIEENKKIAKLYNNTKTKDKKTRSMKYFWIKTGILDVLVKCVTLAITSIGMVYIMIEGSKDYNLLLLAGVNLLMFAGFGLMSLANAYDFYNDNHIPYMLEKIEEVKREKEKLERENKEQLEMAKRKSIHEGHACMDNNRGTNILESSNSNGNISTIQPLVLDFSKLNNSFLGGSIYSSSTFTNSSNLCSTQTISKNEIQKNNGCIGENND